MQELKSAFFAQIRLKQTRERNADRSASGLLVLLPVGNVLIFLRLGVVIWLKFFLFSLLVIVDVSADVETTEKHLKRHWKASGLVSMKRNSRRHDIWCRAASLSLTKKDTMYQQSVCCIHSGNSQSMRSPLKPKTKAPLNWIWSKKNEASSVSKSNYAISASCDHQPECLRYREGVAYLTSWMMVKYFFHHKYLFMCGPSADRP